MVHQKLQQENWRFAYIKKKSDLVLEVCDNGPMFKTESHSGHGLLGIQDKLKLLYADNHAFSWENEPEKCVTICLKEQP